MKRITLAFILTLAVATGTYACDVCGCSLGGSYFGVLPLFNKNFVGLRWSQARFYAAMDHRTEGLPAEYSHDTYSKVELLGRFYVNSRLQLFVFVPYIYNDMNGTEQVVSAHGPGDVTLMANYMLVNTANDKTRQVVHSWLAGGGLKLPTGKFSLEDRGKLVNPNFQMGTGSLDFLLSTMYTVRYKKTGITTEAGYKINTRNSNDYLFGNQFHVSSQLFYWEKFGSVSLLPSAGVYYEQAAVHRDEDIIQVNTGGSGLLFSAGLQTSFKGFTAGVDYKHPLSQNYNSDEIADIRGKDRWTLSLAYNF
jgi:hypothetical protein